MVSRLSAAAAKMDLHPPPGGLLAGFASRLHGAAGVHDPLLARVLLLDDGVTRMAWIACDLLGFSTTDDAAIRRSIAARLEIPDTHIWISCSHTHSGPLSMPFRGPFGQINRQWFGEMRKAIADLAESLVGQLRPADLAYTQATVAGIAYNRQDHHAPIDERLFCVQLRDPERKPIATILNYALHPVVLGESNLLHSADYVGYAAARIEQTIGGVALFIQGSCGDVDPAIYRDAGRHAGTFDTTDAIGRKLANATVSSLGSAHFSNNAALGIASEQVNLPLDPPPTLDELAAMRQDWTRQRSDANQPPTNAEQSWAMFQLAWADELQLAIQSRAVPQTIPVHIAAIRIGPVYAVAFPLEIYSQIGLDIRQNAHPHPVLIAAYTHGLIGYAPTRAAKDQGGYGPGSSHRFFPELLTAIGYGADDLLVQKATHLLRRLAAAEERS